MDSIKRIIYSIKVIDKIDDEQLYDVIYYYFVQAVPFNTHVKLDDSIYDQITYSYDAIRYLDIVSCEEIFPEDSDYYLYEALDASGDIKMFHSKAMTVYKLDEVIR